MPAASITSAPAGTSSASEDPIASIRPSRTRMTPSTIPGAPLPSMTVAPTTARTASLAARVSTDPSPALSSGAAPHAVIIEASAISAGQRLGLIMGSVSVQGRSSAPVRWGALPGS